MDIQYKAYTIIELKDWLLNNKENGLSQHVINRARAYAFLNNPCARDEDIVLVVVFNEYLQPIGYTGAFAEDYSEGNVQGRFFWGSTEWLSPEYRGKGIAAKMMDIMKRAIGYQKYLGLASSAASVKLDMRQGSKVRYYPQYRLRLRSENSFKSRCLTLYASALNRQMLQRSSQFSFQIRVVDFVDEETYQFIRSHSRNDLFLRRQDMFNWLLIFPFVQAIHNHEHLESDPYEFSNYVCEYNMMAVQVRVENTLIGFFIVSRTNNISTLRYLYYALPYSDQVFAAVSSYLIRPGIDEIRFFDGELFSFLCRLGFRSLNTKDIFTQISFTTPSSFEYDSSLSLQGGDGDMLT